MYHISRLPPISDILSVYNDRTQRGCDLEDPDDCAEDDAGKATGAVRAVFAGFFDHG